MRAIPTFIRIYDRINMWAARECFALAVQTSPHAKDHPPLLEYIWTVIKLACFAPLSVLSFYSRDALYQGIVLYGNLAKDVATVRDHVVWVYEWEFHGARFVWNEMEGWWYHGKGGPHNIAAAVVQLAEFTPRLLFQFVYLNYLSARCMWANVRKSITVFTMNTARSYEALLFIFNMVLARVLCKFAPKRTRDDDDKKRKMQAGRRPPLFQPWPKHLSNSTDPVQKEADSMRRLPGWGAVEPVTGRGGTGKGGKVNGSIVDGSIADGSIANGRKGNRGKGNRHASLQSGKY